jgi:ADP-heptose:LPS heptosyltransferase/predicted SAM-dependent methyltransferase
MVWSKETSCGFESRKIWHRAVPYARGLGADIGCGVEKVLPHAIGVDNLHHSQFFGWDQRQAVQVIAEADSLPDFTDESLNFIFSSHLLEHLVEPEKALAEWWTKLRDGGHLMLYLPHKELYPNIGEEGANPDHKHDFMPSDVIRMMEKIGRWGLLEAERRDQDDEYSFWLVFRKNRGGRIHYPYSHQPTKRALVIRPGAIGDVLQASGILDQIKAQGYHVTWATGAAGRAVLLSHPKVDRIINVDDVIPAELWIEWCRRMARETKAYSRVVNLDRSVEGTLLADRDSPSYDWSIEARRALLGDRNYGETIHVIADLEPKPDGLAPVFVATNGEIEWARNGIKDCEGPIVLWAISGSSMHKVYPFVDTVSHWLAKKGVNVVLTGGKGPSEVLEEGIVECLAAAGADMGRIYPRVGKWTIRQTLAFAQVVDCVVGPETGVLNSVAGHQVAKVIYLSHSSPENLTKWWINATVLTPMPDACPCYPCHLLHKDWSRCVKVEETGAALCASEIKPERVFRAIMEAVRK